LGQGLQGPAKADLYFFIQREQTDLKWGTPQPIAFRKEPRLLSLNAARVPFSIRGKFLTEDLATPKTSPTTCSISDVSACVLLNARRGPHLY
jgi:hypothetical protein